MTRPQALIRKAEKTDEENILALTRKEFPYLTIQEIKNRFTNPNITYYTAKTNRGRFLGFADCEHILPHDYWQLSGLAVNKDDRGHGIGSALTKHALKEMKARNAKIITVLVRSHNDIARHIYEKNGFKIKRVLPYNINNDRAIEMRLDVRQGKK